MRSVPVREALAHAEEAFKKTKFAVATKLLAAIGDERALRLSAKSRAKYLELRGDIAFKAEDFATAHLTGSIRPWYRNRKG